MALTIQHSRRIDAQPETVWEQFGDVASWPRWLPIIRGARWLDGEPWTDGARLRMAMAVGPASLGVDVTIANASPPLSVAWAAGRLGVRSLHTWTFTPDNGGTLATSHEALDGPMPQMLGVRALRPMINRMTASWLDSLVARVETGTSTDAT